MTTIEQLDDAVAAAAFRRLVRHLRHRTDAENIELMALAGFCRNCLSDWVQEASQNTNTALDKDAAREAIYGMPYAEWKAKHQGDATPDQLERMRLSMLRNEVPSDEAALDDALADTFPASDPTVAQDPST
ncbi:DUF1244 domain-containing protein [Sphingomonas sp. CJ99]